MADNLKVFGTTYYDVQGQKFTDLDGNEKTYIRPAGTKQIAQNGTADVKKFEFAEVAVPASAVDEGTKQITQNGDGQNVIGYAAVDVNVPGIVPAGTKQINQNGTHDVTQYASAEVNVPNTYAASDEGKVVNNGALTAQTSGTATENGTVDTTLINSLLVNVDRSSAQHFQYTQTENWNSASAGGTTKNFVAVYCTKGAGYYYAKIQNTNTASQAGQEVTYYTKETLLNQGEGGRSRRNSGYYNTMQNDVYFYIGSGSTIDLYFLPVGELIPS